MQLKLYSLGLDFFILIFTDAIATCGAPDYPWHKVKSMAV